MVIERNFLGADAGIFRQNEVLMKKIPLKRIFAAAALVCCLTVTTAYADVTQEDIDNAKNQINNLKNQQKDAQDAVDDINGKKGELESDLNNLNGQMTNIVSSMNALESQINDKKKELSDLEDEIDQTQDNLEAAKQQSASQYEDMKIRIRYMYENGNTPAILDALKKHQVKATFFVVGTYIESEPELIQRMTDEGHTVGNHTWHHPDMSKIASLDTFRKELEDVETAYKNVTGKEMTKYYRPPQGKYSESNLQMAKELGYKSFFWSLAYVDWYQDQQPSKEEAFEKLLNRIHPGALVLLHSTSATNAQILDELLTRWEEMGYQILPLQDLVKS